MYINKIMWLVFFLAVAGFSVQAEEEAVAPIEGGFSLGQEEIVLGLPLFAEFSFRNNTDDDYVFHSLKISPFMRSYNYKVNVFNEAGDCLNIEANFIAISGQLYETSIKSGGVYRQKILINKWYAFTEPGSYSITCSRRLFNYRDKSVKPILVSNALKIVVKPRDEQLYDKAIDSYVLQLRSNNPDIATRACAALSTIKSPRVIDPLAAILEHGGKEDRRFALTGLSQFHSDKIADLLIARMIPDQDELGYQLAYAVCEIGRAQRAVDFFVPQLDDGDVEFRKQVMYALAYLRTEEALPVLLAESKKVNSDLRHVAIKGLGILGSKQAVDVLLEFIDDKDYRTRIEAASSLYKLDKKFDVEWLLPAIKRAKHANDREFHDAMRLIRMYGGNDALPALIDCLRFGDPSGKDSRNLYLIMSISATQGASDKYYKRYHHDPNKNITNKQVKENKNLLKELRDLLKSTDYYKKKYGDVNE